MSNNIKDKLVNPILVVDLASETNVKYWLQLMQVDPMLTNPAVWGVVISELVHAIAVSYTSQRGGESRDVRDLIMGALQRANERFDAKVDATDPTVTVVTVGKPARLN